MKLSTNFSFNIDKGLPWAAAVLLGLTGLGLALAVFFTVQAVHFMAQIPGLKEQLALTEKIPAVKPVRTAPSEKDLGDLRSRLRKLNALKVGGGFSVPALLARVEKQMPAGVRLEMFEQDRPTGEVQLTVVARNLEEFSKFMASLEKDEAFSKVTLTKQSPSSDGSLIQFSLDLVEAAS